jgi:hypothetical protein
MRGGEAAVLGLEHVGGIGVAMLGEQGTEDAGSRRLPGEHALAHAAMVGKHEAGGLLAGVAQGVHGLVGRELQGFGG